MPTYEYECQTCGHRFELFQQMNDDPASACPECRGPVRRLIGTGGGVLVRGNASHGMDSRLDCGRGTRCCGRDEPCDNRPCSQRSPVDNA